MAMLVHLADERLTAKIKRGGLRGEPASIGHTGGATEIHRAVYAMPVLPNFYVSHQWLRELKRGGMRSIAGVYFRMRSDAGVWVGHYGQNHRFLPLGEACSVIMHAPDARGFQIIVPRGIDAGAIHDVRRVQQTVGWRYFPDSHRMGPWKCLCNFCLQSQKGSINARRDRRTLIKRYGAETLNCDVDPARLV